MTSNFYLNSPLPRPEFVKFKINNIPEEIIKEYKLLDKVTLHGYVPIQWLSGRAGAKRSSGPWFETALAL